MIKRALITNIVLCILITLIHIIAYSEFSLTANTQIFVTTSDYIRFIISDTVPFGMDNNYILRFLRSSLILEIIELFIILPVLRTEPDHKKTELIYYGSFADIYVIISKR